MYRIEIYNENLHDKIISFFKTVFKENGRKIDLAKKDIDITQIPTSYLSKGNLTERFENIKKNCFQSIDSNDINFDKIHTAVSFSFGLAENAISYLADSKLDYGDNIERLTLSHIRLNSYDSYSFFNPFNMIIDTVIRDYAELYKFELIDIYDLDKIISILNINVKEASLLMARILYPTRIFDLLEDNYLKEDHKINKTIEYVNSLDKELQRIKNVHSLLKRKYNIRPIEWLRK